MKLPSLLKTPANKRFYIEPRYYDPIKEDIEQRTERIKQIMEVKEAEKAAGLETGSRIQGSFSRDSYFKKSKMGALRFSLMLFLAGGAVGYLYYGNPALYTMMFIVLAYYLYRRLSGRT